MKLEMTVPNSYPRWFPLNRTHNIFFVKNARNVKIRSRVTKVDYYTIVGFSTFYQKVKIENNRSGFFLFIVSTRSRDLRAVHFRR